MPICGHSGRLDVVLIQVGLHIRHLLVKAIPAKGHVLTACRQAHSACIIIFKISKLHTYLVRVRNLNLAFSYSL